MKTKEDFITNSSSSNFIIKTKEELPNDPHIIKITKENVKEIFEEAAECYDSISYNYDDEEIQKIFGFTDEQFFALKVMRSYYCDIDDYIQVLKALETEDYVYYISYDWCSPLEDKLQEYVRKGEIIYHEQ